MKRILVGVLIFILSITTFTFSPRDAYADISSICRSIPTSHVVSVFPNQNNSVFFQAPANETVTGQVVSPVSRNTPIQLVSVFQPTGVGNVQGGINVSIPSWLRLSGRIWDTHITGTPPASEAGKCYGLNLSWGSGGNYGHFFVIVEGNPYPSPNPTYPGTNPTYPGTNPTYPGTNPYQNNQPPRPFPNGNRSSHTWIPGVQRTIATYFIDDERDPLTYSMSGNPPWLRINPNIGEVYGTAPESAGGQSYRITVYATDNKPGHSQTSVTFTLNIQSNNHPPTVNPSYINETATEGISFSKDLSTFFSDRDGDRLNYQLSGSYPPGLNFNSSTGVLSGVPSADGNFSFTVTANDGKGGKANLTVSIVVKSGNRPPNAKNIGPFPTTEEVKIPDIDISSAFTDPDGDTLTYTVTGTLPSGLTFDGNNKITGIPDLGQATNSPYTLTITATDPDGLSASTTIEIQVSKNQPPRLKPGESFPSSYKQGECIPKLTLSDLFEDPDRRGSNLTFQIPRPKLPAGLKLQNGVITGCPRNAYSMSSTDFIPVTVTDVDGNTHTEKWKNLTINSGTVACPASCP